MRVGQTILQSGALNPTGLAAIAGNQPQQLLAFGSPDALCRSADTLAQVFATAQRLGCSTAGEISNDGVSDGTLVLTALHLDHSEVSQSATELRGMADSLAAGLRLAQGLPVSGLLFPFAMLGKDHTELGLIRTILGLDEATGSLTLAGEVDLDGYLKLMHVSADAQVDGAAVAAMTITYLSEAG